MSDPTVTDSEATITEQDVVDYLRKNPAFFVSQPGLLADISLPHESGQAISLVERQVSVLRERNMDMRHRLSKLLDNARDNDRLFDKTKKLVLALLESKNLNDSIDACSTALSTTSTSTSLLYCCLAIARLKPTKPK